MNIKQTRHSLNMSVREFSDALGVSPNAVRRWEMNPIRSGYRTPSRQTMMLIENLLEGGATSHMCGQHRSVK